MTNVTNIKALFLNSLKNVKSNHAFKYFYHFNKTWV